MAPVAHLIASFQAIEAIKILAGQKQAVERQLWKMDMWSRQFKSISVEHLTGTPCSGCKGVEYPYLDRIPQARAVTLCGRNSVQIFRQGNDKIDFPALAARLAEQAEVEFNDYLLRCRKASYEITVFSNGRAIVKGTEDAGQAKSLYSKYIGV